LAYQNDTVPPCGLFGWSLFCPFKCGFFKRLFRIGNCTNKKIEPVPVPISVLVPIPTPVLVPVPVRAPVPVPTVPVPIPVSAPKTPTKAPLPCVDATTIVIDPETQSGNVLGNTTNITDVDTVRNTTNHSSCDLYNGIGIWYKINPLTNHTNLTATTCGGGDGIKLDTVITVYEGDNCRPQVCVAQNDAYYGSIKCSNIEGFAVSPFVTHWIFVDGSGTGDKGKFTLRVDVK
jgi:hypothetical protein